MTKKYLNIGEVSNLLNIKEHVIRYWDSIDPKTNKIRINGLSTKTNGGTRYFNKENIEKLEKLKSILYIDGVHIKSIKLAERLIDSKKNRKKIENHENPINSKYYKNSEKINQILEKMRKLLK